MARGLRACTILATLAAAALVAPAAALAGSGRATEDESDCFWLGPISFDKRATNPERFDGHFFNFPEESATYWLARFRLAAGQRLELHGRYPRARYESLNSYVEGSVCAAVNDPDRSVERTVQDIPASLWDALVQTPGPRSDPRTSPAFDPPQWERFFSQLFSAGVFAQAAGNPRPTAGMEETGGFYSNRDTRYVLTHLSRRFGEVLVIRGRMPTFPRTYGGARRMPRAQLRFWSLCSNEGRVTTYASDCLADRQVPLTRNRRFTIVVSKTADRPRNARARCGVAWLQWSRDGESPGGRRGYGLLILRNMLAAPGFEQAVQRIERFGDERRVMGPYFPRSTYTSTRAFERRGC